MDHLHEEGLQILETYGIPIPRADDEWKISWIPVGVEQINQDGGIVTRQEILDLLDTADMVATALNN